MTDQWAEDDSTLGWLRETQRALEERLVEGRDETAPLLFVRHQGELALTMGSGEAWALMRAAPIAVSGFDGDELVFAADTYVSKSKTNPEGKPWRRGEMQERIGEPAVAALLGEAVIVLRARREGPDESVVASYERLVGSRIAWGEAKAGGTGSSGRMPHALHDAVRVPWLSAEMTALGLQLEDFDLTPEQATAHRHSATIRRIADEARMAKSGVVFAFPTRADQRSNEIIQASMRRAGLATEVRDLPRRGGEWWRG
jgi:hypothetical protein